MFFNLDDGTILLYLALLVSGVGLVISALALVFSCKALAFSKAQCQQLAHDLKIAQGGAMGMGQKIISLERRMQHSGGDANISHIQDRPYAEATNLFSLGLDQDEVARRCSLSRGEASLLATLQKHAKVS